MREVRFMASGTIIESPVAPFLNGALEEDEELADDGLPSVPLPDVSSLDPLPSALLPLTKEPEDVEGAVGVGKSGAEEDRPTCPAMEGAGMPVPAIVPAM